MMAQSIIINGLPLGESQEASAIMMQETKDAMEAAIVYVVMKSIV